MEIYVEIYGRKGFLSFETMEMWILQRTATQKQRQDMFLIFTQFCVNIDTMYICRVYNAIKANTSTKITSSDDTACLLSSSPNQDVITCQCSSFSF